MHRLGACLQAPSLGRQLSRALTREGLSQSVFVLYLNSATFVGDAGLALAAEACGRTVADTHTYTTPVYLWLSHAACLKSSHTYCSHTPRASGVEAGGVPDIWPTTAHESARACSA